LLMVPAFIVYSSFVSFSAMSLISFIVGLIFLPLIPIVIASLLGMAISVIASRFKIPNMVNALLMTLVLLALMASSFARSFNPNNFNMEQLVDITNMLSNTVYKIYPLTQIFTDGICKGNLLSLGLFVAISAVVFGAFVFVVSRRYKSICTKLTEKRTNGSFKLGTLAGSSSFLALYKKELKRYVGSTIYMFNTAFGAIFLLIASAASIFLDFSKIPQTESVIGILLPVLPMAMAIMISTICTTGCSISLEGKNFWIVKTMPLTATQLYNSKLAVNLTISLPTVLISSVLLTIGLKQSPLTLALMLITGVVFSLFVAVFGLLVNIKLPNFEWKNDAMAVKQGMSSFVSVMVPMFLTMGLAVLSFALPSPLTVVIIDSAFLLISVIMYIVVKKIPLNRIGEN
ncbi:MAG: hypothetical protein RR209_04440, partial [Angelakisella sp.]